MDEEKIVRPFLLFYYPITFVLLWIMRSCIVQIDHDESFFYTILRVLSDCKGKEEGVPAKHRVVPICIEKVGWCMVWTQLNLWVSFRRAKDCVYNAYKACSLMPQQPNCAVVSLWGNGVHPSSRWYVCSLMEFLSWVQRSFLITSQPVNRSSSCQAIINVPCTITEPARRGTKK